MSNTCDILADYAELHEFAQAVKVSTRTIIRYCEVDGLPYTKFGRKRLIHIPTAKEWLATRTRKRNPSRKARAA